MPVFLTLLLCCLQCNIIALAAPATLDTSALSLNAFTTSPLDSHVTTNLLRLPHLPLNTSAFLNTTSPDNAMIPYRVPNTPTTLKFGLLQNPIQKANMGRTILRTQQALRAQIASTYQLRDLPLQPDDEPYKSDPYWTGCFLGVIAWPPVKPPRFIIEYHLTYGIVENVLQGLWEFLYRGDRFVEAAFEVIDDQWGLVGLGKVTTKRPGLGGGDDS